MEEEVKKVCDFKKFDTNSRLQDLRPIRIPYHVPIATVLFGFALVLIAFVKGVPSSVLPSSVLAATAKSGFTAAFTLIFVSEIGDKGETGANRIVGIQVPSNEMDELHDSANKLGLMYLKFRENAMQRKLAEILLVIENIAKKKCLNCEKLIEQRKMLIYINHLFEYVCLINEMVSANKCSLWR